LDGPSNLVMACLDAKENKDIPCQCADRDRRNGFVVAEMVFEMLLKSLLFSETMYLVPSSPSDRPMEDAYGDSRLHACHLSAHSHGAKHLSSKHDSTKNPKP
jgi:hypothetical protein